MSGCRQPSADERARGCESGRRCLDVARVAVLCALLLAGGGASRAQDLAGDTVPLPDNPLAGRTLFESKLCHDCHGISASESGVGPNLGDGRFSGTFLELGAGLWNHVPGMSVSIESAGLEWPQLTGEEAVRLLVFLNSIEYLGRPGEAENGERLFREQGCSSCHSIGAGDQIGPDLSELVRFASPLYVAQGIWNHGPSMLESIRSMGLTPPRFAGGDLADISAFIRQRAETAVAERTLMAPGNPNAGKRLFVSKGCSRCHGPAGGGGSLGPDLRQADLHVSAEAIAGDMWNHALAMRDTMRQQGMRWPEFEDSELADLVAYLYFLPFADPSGDPVRGESVFVDRSCAGCHVADPESGETALVEAPGLDSLSELTQAEFVSALWNHAPVMREVILARGRPWPELTGADLQDLQSYLVDQHHEP